MMSGNTPNQVQIQKHISSAFDSVNLITNKITEPIGDQTKNIVLVNSKHLQLMLLKQWFVNSITTQQYDTINNCIISGMTYCD
jgi:hypothetical protein